ncbi:hypothetical protein HPP92_012952 [Vanilla planifolia]|uniref:F-box domain-containing protein n=1 Tax=Vanilla planifolia TaxID=51239 RepID=A0A835R1H5_VANPL|nr:hypothetical protein HPP92_013420 [Vanilla planifolia]KAG0478233.1 hypothetical protein HPP92_012952 [Vanilla planifolia]
MAASPSSSTSSSSASPAYYQTSSITQMNEDHLLPILCLLPLDSIISFSMTCRRFRSLSSSEVIWEGICRREWGSGAVDALLDSLSSHERREVCWKRLYQRISQVNLLSCKRLFNRDGNFPTPRASQSLNFVSDCLILFGGGSQGGRHLDDTWVAQIGNRLDSFLSWKQVGSGTPSGRFGHTCTIVGSDLVLFGGINDHGIRHSDTWVGRVIQDGSSGIKVSWRLLDAEPVVPPARGAHAACCIGEQQILIHGGMGQNGLRLNDTWMLDLSDNHHASWHQIVHTRPSPSARSGHSITWIGDKRIVLFGGRGAGYEALNDLWILDIGEENPKWNELTYESSSLVSEMPLPRVGHSATMLMGRKILVYGGEDSLRHRKGDFWVLDVGSILRFLTTGLKKNLRRMWRKLQVEGLCPNYRSFHSACADLGGCRVYVFGGMVDGVVHPGEAYGLRFDGELYLLEFLI